MKERSQAVRYCIYLTVKQDITRVENQLKNYWKFSAFINNIQVSPGLPVPELNSMLEILGA